MGGSGSKCEASGDAGLLSSVKLSLDSLSELKAEELPDEDFLHQFPDEGEGAVDSTLSPALYNNTSARLLIEVSLKERSRWNGPLQPGDHMLTMEVYLPYIQQRDSRGEKILVLSPHILPDSYDFDEKASNGVVLATQELDPRPRTFSNIRLTPLHR